MPRSRRWASRRTDRLLVGRLGELLEGRLAGRILHLGTFETLGVDREEAERFRDGDEGSGDL